MEKYLNRAILIDSVICLLLGITLVYFKSTIECVINVPNEEELGSFGSSLITVSATLVGFLLTIITVIVTFKNGFEDVKKIDKKPEIKQETNEEVFDTVFNKKITKEEQFYSTPIHKKVADVFLFATYEIGIVFFILLLLQFNIIQVSTYITFILTFLSFLIMLVAIFRSFYIFKLFLNVHLHGNKKDND